MGTAVKQLGFIQYPSPSVRVKRLGVKWVISYIGILFMLG